MAFYNPRSAISLLLLLLAAIFSFSSSFRPTQAQVVSYGMRKLALSMNQFGLDMLRTMDRMDRVLNSSQPMGSFAFCPFCVGSSLAMLLAGLRAPGGEGGEAQESIVTPSFTTKPTAFDSLRHALYLGQMQPQEINLAFYDLAAHLQLNLPEGFKAKRSISDDIEDMSEEIDDTLENDEEAEEDEEEDAELPAYPKFKRSIRRGQEDQKSKENQDPNDDDEEVAEEYRSSDASTSSEYAMAEPDELYEYRSSPGGHLLPPADLFSSGGTSLMHFLSQIYIQRYLPVNYNYYVLMQYYYKTPIRSLDFAYAPEESRQHINAMVEHMSKEKIKNILGEEESGRRRGSGVRLLLLSGLYFEGKLDFRDQVKMQRDGKAFGALKNRVHKNSKRPTQALAMIMSNVTGNQKVQGTAHTLHHNLQQSPPPPSPPKTTFNPFKPFGTNPARTKESIRLRYSFSSYLNATIVEMPFTGGIITLVALVPVSSGSRSMATILSRLNAQLIVDLVQNLEIRRIDVTMPLLNLTHSIANWNILFTQMGLASIFDHAQEYSEESLETFAGIRNFPLAQVTQLQHKTVLDIGIEDNNHQQGGEEGSPPPKRESNLSKRPKTRMMDSTKILRIAKRSSPTLEIVQSQIMKVLQPYERDQMLAAQSKELPVMSSHQQNTKRIHVNLEDEFIYLILDNISGLVLAMGKYKPERS